MRLNISRWAYLAFAVSSVFFIWAKRSTAQILPPAGYSISGPLNFTGGVYESYSGTNAVVQFVNGSGEVAGYSARYATSAYVSSSTGQDIWLYDGTISLQIGLLGGVYAGYYQESNLVGLNNAGQAIGYSYRVNGGQGYDAWFFNGTSSEQIGLTGAGYQFLGGGVNPGISEVSQPDILNDTGDVAGTSARVDSSGDELGVDTWFFNGTTTQQIGFYGSGYQYVTSGGGIFEESSPQLMNNAGEVVGTSERYDSSGNTISGPAWLFNGTTTVPLGLAGPGYQYNYTGPGGGVISFSQVKAINNAGDVVGDSQRFDATGHSLGFDTWILNGTTTQQIGMVGRSYQYTNSSGGIVQYSVAVAMNKSGEVIGDSAVYNGSTGIGQDAWIYNGSSTQKIGLAGPAYVNIYTGGTSNNASLLNNAGQVAGTVQRASATTLGNDCWFFDGNSTQEIGLTGGVYEYINNGAAVRDSSLIALNDVGDVVGQSQRFSPTGGTRGSDAWFFDSAEDMTYALQFSVSSGGISLTQPEVLTDSGVVVGYYDLYTSGSSYISRGFWWSEPDGFHDLGTLVDGDASSTDWTNLANALFAAGDTPGGAPRYIVGGGTFLNNGTGDGGVYELTANVPEPACFSAFMVAIGVGLLGHRRVVRG